jgi:hypothetical protein
MDARGSVFGKKHSQKEWFLHIQRVMMWVVQEGTYEIFYTESLGGIFGLNSHFISCKAAQPTFSHLR